MFTNLAHLQSLQFNVAGLLKDPIGGTRAYKLYVPVSELDQLDESFDVTGPLTGAVRLLKTIDTILVQVQASTHVRLECSRCLDSFDSAIEFSLEEEFYPSVDVNTGRVMTNRGDDAALEIDEQHILDLSEVVRQGLILALPIVPLCRPDCAGLCPVCGANRNLEPCTGHEADIDPRWGALGAWLSLPDEDSVQ